MYRAGIPDIILPGATASDPVGVLGKKIIISDFFSAQTLDIGVDS
jgi:hypothetical protein